MTKRLLLLSNRVYLTFDLEQIANREKSTETKFSNTLSENSKLDNIWTRNKLKTKDGFITLTAFYY